MADEGLKLSPEGTASIISCVAKFLSAVVLIDTMLRNTKVSEEEAALMAMIEATQITANVFSTIRGEIPRSGPMTAPQLAKLLKATLDEAQKVREKKG